MAEYRRKDNDKNVRLSTYHHALIRVLSYHLNSPFRSLVGQGLELIAAKHPELKDEYPAEPKLYSGLAETNHGEK